MENSPKCKHCGTPFTPYRPWQEFCSPSHRAAFYSRYVRNSCGEAIYVIDEEIRKAERSEAKNEKSAEG